MALLQAKPLFSILDGVGPKELLVAITDEGIQLSACCFRYMSVFKLYSQIKNGDKCPGTQEPTHTLVSKRALES